jgi:hypothetical protein
MARAQRCGFVLLTGTLGGFALIRAFEKIALVDTRGHWVVGQVGQRCRERVNK